MSDELLKQILDKLNALESGQKELHDITRAIRSRQDETNAKLDALTSDLDEFRTETAVSFKRFERRVKSIETDLDETMVRIEKQ